MDDQAIKSRSAGILTRSTSADIGLVQDPILTPHLESRRIGDDQTLLVSEAFNTLLHGKLYQDVLPLLDGNNSITEITSRLAAQYDEDAVHTAIYSLANKGYVVSAAFAMNRSIAAYWSALGASPRWVERILTQSVVTVSEPDGTLKDHLQQQQVRVNTESSNLVVIVCDDLLDAHHVTLNQQYLASNTAWMLVRPGGIESIFGPVFPSDRVGPCWECLQVRLRCHQEVHSFLRNVGGESAAFRPFVKGPGAQQTVYGTVAREIAKWFVFGEEAPIHQHAVSFNLGSHSSQQHKVQRRPQCTVCGDQTAYSATRSAVPVVLKSGTKGIHKPFTGGGGTRSVAPGVTLSKYRHLVSPISGVVSWLTRTSDESDFWLHVYWAGSNFGMSSRTLTSLRRSLRSKSAGKGCTREQSQVGALCEAIERYSGSLQGGEIIRRGRLIELAQDDLVIHPNDVQLFSDCQLDNASKLNAQGHPYNIVPPRLDVEAEISWTPVWSFTQQRHRYLPTTMLYSMPAELRGDCDFIADSNGCASGNTLEEAILQAFYELVERDAFAIWWYNQLQVPAVDISSFDDEFLSSAAEYYSQFERELWILDVTADIDIPTFVALSRRTGGPTEEIIYGAGTHPDPSVAAIRAVCELNQSLIWLPSVHIGEGRAKVDDPLALWWWRTGKLEHCPWLVPSTEQSTRTALNHRNDSECDLRDEVERCRALVETQDMEFLVLDQTRADVDMPVVRVLVPGLRHFWSRLAPGRLYEVPVHMKKREVKLKEAEMNSMPVIA